MQVPLLLALFVTCHGARARIHRDVQEPQKFVQAAVYPLRRNFGNALPTERSSRAKSRVFRNVQAQRDEEPRLYRASGRFQKRVVAAVPTHDVTTASPRPASLDSSAVSQFNYDEDVHNLNKLTEDNSILEEAAEFAKGLERTTVAVRGDEELRTTTAPANNFANAPAIITPRTSPEGNRQQLKQPSSTIPQHTSAARPQQDIFTNTVNTQNNAGDSMLPPNPMTPASNSLHNVFRPPNIGQAGTPVQPFTVQPTGPTQVFPIIPTQVQPGVPTAVAQASLRNAQNPSAPQLGAMQQFPPNIHFPQGQMPPVPARHFAGASQPPTPPSVVLPPQPPLAGQIPPAQGAAIGLPPRPVSPPPLPPRVEIINAQAANSSLEQLGCGFDWLTNTCKDVFNIGWCGQCHDFGNIFVHDCKCVRPLIVLPRPPQPQPRSPHSLFSMI